MAISGLAMDWQPMCWDRMDRCGYGLVWPCYGLAVGSSRQGLGWTSLAWPSLSITRLPVSLAVHRLVLPCARQALYFCIHELALPRAVLATALIDLKP